MEKKVWNCYIEYVQPNPNYSPTIERRKMIRARHAEMVAKGQTSERALLNMLEAIIALSEDDYHMGRKKGYKGAGRKGFEEIFRTQDVFEDWCSKCPEDYRLKTSDELKAEEQARAEAKRTMKLQTIESLKRELARVERGEGSCIDRPSEFLRKRIGELEAAANA